MRVLIVDDDRDLLRALRIGLEQNGHQVVCAVCGDEALNSAYSHQPDVVVLDILLPGIDGWEICRRLRDICDVPIVFLSIQNKEKDIVNAFDLGADDYLTKPFSLAELEARLGAAVRRAHTAPVGDPLVYDNGDFHIDLKHHIVQKQGVDITVSPKEFHILACLIRNANRVVPHAELLREVWGPGYETETGYLALYIRYLRQKIEDDPSNPRYICTRFRVGYYFRSEHSQP